ncbi:hypothetical protein N7E81_10425 [Reichenbachiella carrageenanivorans]|uniref:Uncharacterized protein n=1 Tax=Reichenbachiella carrageenanivorans TaxID=2979869 RepID=A0ABY6CV39_9BACT|nr:hypothetical protein [Reichenbachiella carrageenanivorans]UXX77785.1 hypothetical protein N7E81_10425 [Reichenbachiella carrageenanivorans]
MYNPDNKYEIGTEFFLLSFLDPFQILHSGDIKGYIEELKENNSKDQSNIYFILRRPKICLIPESFKTQGTLVSMDFEVWNKRDRLILTSQMNFPMMQGKISMESEYPFTKFKLVDTQGNSISSRPTSIIGNSNQEIGEFQFLLDYEILYIGKSYGTDGNRNSLDRLVNHETYQQILTDSMNDHPDKEVFVLIGNFAQKYFMVSLPYEQYPENDNEEMQQHFFNNSGLNISESQLISVTEGMLIRYFSPEYNEKFKEIFPSKSHVSYSKLFDMNVRALALEVITGHEQTNFFTNKTGRLKKHFQNFELVKTDGRFNIFEIDNYSC